MTEQNVMSERTIVIERVFDAPRDLVWKAWTDPDEVATWWGPECFTTPRETIDFDLRPGGVRRLTMVGPDGEEYPSEGRFGIVEPPARLSFAEDIADNPMIESAAATIDFVELGPDRTKVVIRADMVCADELVAMAEEGWRTQLDKLERRYAAA